MIYAIIVLYNKSIFDSITFENLIKWNKKINIIIFDNSTSDFGNKQWCFDNNIIYIGDGNNRGLSFAYNRAIEFISPKENDLIVILDDDTNLNNDYITELLSLNEINIEYDIFLPIVKTNNYILSPSNMKNFGRVVLVNNMKELVLERITAINSGMIVRGEVFSHLRYDEKLFLDCVDHDFMNQIKLNNYKIKILKSSITQTYSRESDQEIEIVKNRFNIFQRDFKTFCKKYNYYFYYYFSIFNLRLANFKRFGISFFYK